MSIASSSARPEFSEADLARYGILRSTSELFTVGEYRYARVEDAVAEARRRMAAGGAIA